MGYVLHPRRRWRGLDALLVSLPSAGSAGGVGSKSARPRGRSEETATAAANLTNEESVLGTKTA